MLLLESARNNQRNKSSWKNRNISVFCEICERLIPNYRDVVYMFSFSFVGPLNAATARGLFPRKNHSLRALSLQGFTRFPTKDKALRRVFITTSLLALLHLIPLLSILQIRVQQVLMPLLHLAHRSLALAHSLRNVFLA